ncbi:hypothetical protein F5876DRAFT_54336, partial [Lentinula aff. lateritia]
LDTNQRGLKGNIIIFPQKVSSVSKILLPSVEELSEPICIIFVESTQPSNEWLRAQAKPLTVQPGRVRRALLWLKTHNRWYKDIIINKDLLNSLPKESTLPVHIEHVLPDQINESLTASYDQSANGPAELHETGITFESIVIADVDGDTTVNEL